MANLSKNKQVVYPLMGDNLVPEINLQGSLEIPEDMAQRQTGPTNAVEKAKSSGTTPYTNGTFSYTPYYRSAFSYKDAPEYINRYQQQIDDLSNRILHWQGFNYNVNADPLYQQYAEQYNRNGQNAMRNALAQISARTGGMASSYAGTAAQNAYNEYMQGLNDKIPELYQLAYDMYNDKLNKQRNDLSMLEALEQGDYGKYVDLLNQYNTDRNLAYNVWNATESAKEDSNDLMNQYAYKMWLEQQDQANQKSSYESQIKQLQDALTKATAPKEEKPYSGTGGYTSKEKKDQEAESTKNKVLVTLGKMKNNGATNEEIFQAMNEAMDNGLLPRSSTGSDTFDALRSRYSRTSLTDDYNNRNTGNVDNRTPYEQLGDSVDELIASLLKKRK